MDDTATISAARNFLALMRDGRAPSSQHLLRALDELTGAYHQTPEGDPADNDAAPPRGDYQERRSEIARRFPDYGYYTLSEPTGPVDGEQSVCDAIDDLADISADLEEVVWRFGTFGADDAHWHFRFLFEIHWGMHLRELSLYLHANALRSSAELDRSDT